jgi:hypothetical protein
MNRWAEADQNAPTLIAPKIHLPLVADPPEPETSWLAPRSRQGNAHVGQPITVHVNSDATDELHVHSTPDKEFAISPTANQTFNFTIDSPGKIEVELHHLDQTVVTIDVTP